MWMQKQMSKYIILLLGFCVCWLGFSYHNQIVQDRAVRLVTNAYYGNLLEVKNAIEQGVRMDYILTFNDPGRDYAEQTFNALQAAASGGNEDVILLFLEQGMDINQPTQDGWTPLFIAARDGQAEAAKLLIFKEADLNAQTKLGSTALTMVVTQPYPTEKARLDLLEYMLKRGADPNLEDVYHHTPLYYAKAKGNEKIIALLQTYSAKP